MSRRQRVVLGALTGALVLTGCGGAARSTLARAQDSVTTARRAFIDIQLASRNADDAATGFRVTGRYALSRPPHLPVLDLAYFRVGTVTEERRVVSTGEAMWAGPPNAVDEIPAEATAALRERAASRRAFATLRFARWLRSPQSRKGRGGANVVVGEVDVASLLQDLAPIVHQVQGDGATTTDARGGVDHLAVPKPTASEMAVATRGDGSLRALRVVVNFPRSALEQLRAALGPYAGSRITVGVRFQKLAHVPRVPTPTATPA